jgi:hypothetical protein
MVARSNDLPGPHRRSGGAPQRPSFGEKSRAWRCVTLHTGGKYTSSEFTVSSSADPGDRPDTTASGKDGREAERLAVLEHLGAVSPAADHVLQELVDEVRGVYGTDLCMINLNLSDVQYFRAWSGSWTPIWPKPGRTTWITACASTW